MQGKGLITIIAVALGLICITELLPTWYANKIESEAKALAGNNEEKYQKELDKLSKDTLNLGFTKLYYTNAKERERFGDQSGRLFYKCCFCGGFG